MGAEVRWKKFLRKLERRKWIMGGAFIALSLLMASALAIKSGWLKRGKGDGRFSVGLRVDKGSPTGIYIPKDLEDCHRELDRSLSEDGKAFLAGKMRRLSSDEAALFDFGYGQFGIGALLRDKWGLYKESRLVGYFNGFGLYHPYDISAVILDSYKAKLRGERYDPGKEIVIFKKAAAGKPRPPEFTDPESGGRVMAALSRKVIFLQDKVHVGLNVNTGEVWYHDPKRGWYKPSSQERKARSNTSWVEVLTPP